LPLYQSAVEDEADFRWSVAPIPYVTEEPVMNIYGASISMPIAEPEKQLAAWLFLKYYTNPEVQTTWAQASNDFPVRTSVAVGLTEAGYLEANPAYATAFDMLQYGTAEPATPGYDYVRNMVEDAMAAIVEGADVQSTLDQLTEDANLNLTKELEK
jgi:multiple sugar transport system substrate-binding protein/sn-glycerol 3-phosphate transport system substrate-binding protein